MKKPFPRSYWARKHDFLAGYIPGSLDSARTKANLKGLLDAGIRCLINLMEADEKNYQGVPFAPYEPMLKKLASEQGIDIAYHNIPIKDRNIPSIQTMRLILDIINTSLAAGIPVYVHCWGGKGRTGTVVGCWLLEQGIAMPVTVLAKIQELRKDDPKSDESSPETAAQIEFVLNWGLEN